MSYEDDKIEKKLRRGKKAEQLLEQIEIDTSHVIKGIDEINCGDNGCKKRVDEMYHDFYKDGGVRDRSRKSVCRDDFVTCQGKHENALTDFKGKYATKSIFWTVFSIVIVGIGATLITISVNVANSASEEDMKKLEEKHRVELEKISNSISEIKSIIQTDRAVQAVQSKAMSYKIDMFIAASQIKDKELEERIKANEKEDDRYHHVQP